MSRLTIDITSQQHQSLKALAALQGKTISNTPSNACPQVTLLAIKRGRSGRPCCARASTKG
jgi:hypothetical protein